MDDRMISSKSVKINKSHRCWGCGRVIKPGVTMTRTTHIEDGKIESIYWCIVCTETMDNHVDDLYGEEISEGEIKSGYAEEWEDMRYALEVEGGIVS